MYNHTFHVYADKKNLCKKKKPKCNSQVTLVGVSLYDHTNLGRKHLKEPEKSDFTKLCSKHFIELNFKKKKKNLILRLKWL